MSNRVEPAVSPPIQGLRRRRALSLAARGAAAMAAAAVATGAAGPMARTAGARGATGERAGLARAASDNDAMVGSWLVAAAPPGATAVPPARILVSVLSDGVAIRTAPLQQAA